MINLSSFVIGDRPEPNSKSQSRLRSEREEWNREALERLIKNFQNQQHQRPPTKLEIQLRVANVSKPLIDKTHSDFFRL